MKVLECVNSCHAQQSFYLSISEESLHLMIIAFNIILMIGVCLTVCDQAAANHDNYSLSQSGINFRLVDVDVNLSAPTEKQAHKKYS